MKIGIGKWRTRAGDVAKIVRYEPGYTHPWIGKICRFHGDEYDETWSEDGKVDMPESPALEDDIVEPIYETAEAPDSSAGRKDDSGKLRFDLVPPEAEEAIVKVLTDGAKEYGDNNWQSVTPFFQRYVAAILRHTNLRRKGEAFDQKSGSPHWAHVAANAMFLLWKDLQEQREKQRCDAISAGVRLASMKGTTLSTETSIACPAGSNTGSGSSDAG